MDPGLSEPILKAIKEKAGSMSRKSRVCAGCVDEMMIRERVAYSPKTDRVEGFEDLGPLGRTKFVANHAVTFMVRGLSPDYKWKLPLGYVLSSGPLSGEATAKLLTSFIGKVEEAGLIVRAVVCDQGSNNQNMMYKHLKVSKDRPYFNLNNNAIHTFFDTPHLLKNTRSNLKKTGYTVGGRPVDWKWILEFYEQDKKLPVRSAPKLTDRHLHLPPFTSMNVRLAAQVLSHSVAAGITCMVSYQTNISAEDRANAQHTAMFIEMMDKLFNAFNSRSTGASAQMRGAMSEKSGHVEFLRDCLTWLSTLKAQSGRKLPCLEGWKHNINSLLLLWEELRREFGFTKLHTNQLNQDCLENFFSVIRGKGGHRFNPDSQQFRTAFQQVLVEMLMNKTQEGKGNCEKDFNSFLTAIVGSTTTDPQPPTELRSTTTSTSAVPGTSRQHPMSMRLLQTSFRSTDAASDPQLAQQYSNIVAYISGYIGRRLKQKVCAGCLTEMKGKLDDNNKDHLLLKAKQYAAVQEGLFVPSDSFLTKVKCLETCFCRTIGEAIYKDGTRGLGVGATLLNALKMTPAFMSLQCQEEKKCNAAEEILSIYIGIRLNFVIKLNNRDLQFQIKPRHKKKNMKMLTIEHR